MFKANELITYDHLGMGICKISIEIDNVIYFTTTNNTELIEQAFEHHCPNAKTQLVELITQSNNVPQCYVIYRDRLKNFEHNIKSFSTYENAWAWVLKTFDTPDKDSIGYYYL